MSSRNASATRPTYSIRHSRTKGYMNNKEVRRFIWKILLNLGKNEELAKNYKTRVAHFIKKVTFRMVHFYNVDDSNPNH
jgi:hypothetical protein